MRPVHRPSLPGRTRLRTLTLLLGLVLTMPLLAGCDPGDGSWFSCLLGDHASCDALLNPPPPPPPPVEGAPAAPTGLTAAIAANGDVSIDWNDNTETDLSGYNVYRGSYDVHGVPQYGLLAASTASGYADGFPKLDGTTYFWVVTAFDMQHNESARSDPASLVYCAPTHSCHAVPGPPAAPTGLVPVLQDANGITLDWNDNTEADLDHYSVYKATASGAFGDSLFSSPRSPSEAQVSASTYSLDPFTNYFFAVTAQDDDGDGLESPRSAEAKVYFCPSSLSDCPRPPAATTNLHVVSRDAGGVSLAWDVTPGTNVARYAVYTSHGVFDLKLAGTTTGTSWVDPHPDATFDNNYAVAAVDVDGRQGARSNEVTTRWCGAANPTCTTGPAAPTGLVATRQPFQIALDWADNNEPDLAGYNAQLAFDAAGPWSNANHTLLTASRFTVVDLPPNRALFFRVVAVDTAGHVSPPSAVVSSSACSSICSLFSAPSLATRQAASAFKLRLRDTVTRPGARRLDGIDIVGTGDGLSGSFVLRPAPAGLDGTLRKLAANGLGGTLRAAVDWRVSPLLHTGTSTTTALAAFADAQLGKACLRLTETYSLAGKPTRLATQGTFTLLGGSATAQTLFGEGSYTVKTRRNGTLAYKGTTDQTRTAPPGLPAACQALDVAP